jgi:hypothetical protein
MEGWNEGEFISYSPIIQQDRLTDRQLSRYEYAAVRDFASSVKADDFLRFLGR